MRVVIKSLPFEGRYGFPYREHSVQDVDPDEAVELVRAGIANFHEQGMTIETAMNAAPENMMRRTVAPPPVPESEPVKEAPAEELEAEAPQGKKGKKKKSAEEE